MRRRSIARLEHPSGMDRADGAQPAPRFAGESSDIRVVHFVRLEWWLFSAQGRLRSSWSRPVLGSFGWRYSAALVGAALSARVVPLSDRPAKGSRSASPLLANARQKRLLLAPLPPRFHRLFVVVVLLPTTTSPKLILREEEISFAPPLPPLPPNTRRRGVLLGPRWWRRPNGSGGFFVAAARGLHRCTTAAAGRPACLLP